MASSSNSQWHSINPQTRPLTLSILELTPLALTLSLTLAPQTSPSTPFNIQSHGASHHVAHTHNHAHGPTPSKHKKKPRHRRPDSDDEAIAVDLDDDHLSSPVPGTYPSGGALDHTTNFKDLLSHGVVVSVNGQPWNRIVAHVSDPDEELADGEQEDVEPNEGEDDWEDDAEQVGEEGPSTGITRRRPRRARFGASAGNAVKAEEGKDTPRRRTKPATAKQHDKMVKDQAVVVVYGLTPGKEYDIELQVVGLSGSDGMDAVLSQSIMVPASPSPALPRSRANSLRARSIPRSRSNSATGVHPSTQDLFLGNSSGGNTPPATDTPPAPIPTNILNPVDTQAAQIRHMIAAAHAEKDLVQNQIKEARRAAQRAEAALKVEIESVKKATEKAGSMDLRAKQKALALQEQVKQGWTGAEHAEAEAAEVDQGMHELEDKLESAKIEVETVKAEWLSIKKSEDESKEVDRKTRSEEEKKLAEVVSKVDKLRAKKEKKEAEKAELERKLEDLERQRLEVERRNEEDRNNKRTSGFWFDPYQNHAQANHNHAPHNRTLTNHPSLTNLSAGQGFRPRGGFQGRFASAGAPRTGPSQPSPTHANTFYTSQHPAPSSSPGPTFRPPKAMVGSPSANTRSNSTPGVNVSAMPFHPSNMDSAQQHTTLMPPQLQHRIYLPNVRPRPTPNFNPPPSVMAEQAQRQSPTMLSAPSFPPLPGQAGQTGGNKQTSGGPSLASIVTRAVLSPTALAAQENAVARLSPPPMRSNLYSAQNPSGGNTLPTSPPTKSSTQNAVGQSNPASRQNTLAQQQPERVGEFPPLSPTGPWGMVRMATPPVSGWNAQGRESPSSSGGGTGSAQTSRRGTADA